MEKTLQHRHETEKIGRSVAALRGKRRELERKIARLDAQISKLRPVRKVLPLARLDRLLDQLSDGLPKLPPLPPDFSRADLYEDHD